MTKSLRELQQALGQLNLQLADARTDEKEGALAAFKEQAIHGRIFKNLEEVRVAVVAFKDRYNREGVSKSWASCPPLEARQARLMKLAA
ncbi:hypothetical protein [Burkholderia territorii]|uniref:hypothetical protein n=1 Tax=Burkholderia territorii TaxID=1503055 RepID=UPI0007581870|nr:hypothetical protein [Burkholderia territorii]KWE31867.1 hypothetical protein WT49_20135 [Burkholderia territorii]KWE46953.1 hypothetical protein WT50_08800 [Burkholderia territorii]KWE54309.1 hypothetical protein WT51_03625 [Burkholderia territorii]